MKEIWKSDFNLAIWPRAPFDGEGALRAALREGTALSIETGLDLSRTPRGLDPLLPDAGLHPAFAAAWHKDMLDLVVLFAGLAQTTSVRLRLETVRDAACRLFHVDYVSLRLICTYVGRGTEYLEESNTDRSGLGKGRNTAVVRDRRQVRRLAANHVGLFKGLGYPGNASRGIVHRSPPASMSAPRLVLCLDTAER